MQRGAQALRALVQGSAPGDGVFSAKSVVGKRLSTGEPKLPKVPKDTWKTQRPPPGFAEDIQESDVYDPAHSLESDPVLTGTLQEFLITALDAENGESGGGNTKFTMSDVLYSLLPSHLSLFSWCEGNKWRLSKILRNHVVRNCILMELAAHTRKGYLPLFKKPAEWSQEATVTSQWAQVLNNDAAQHNYQSEQVVSQENLAAFAWLQRGDDRRAIDCRDFVHNTISNGLAHHASRIECSLLGEHGYVLDGQRAVLETIDLASAKQCAPEGVLILPIGTLRLPKPMENYLRIVQSIGEQHRRTQGLSHRVGETESDDTSRVDLTTGEAAGQRKKQAIISELQTELAATLEIAKKHLTVQELEDLQLKLNCIRQGSSAPTLHPPSMAGARTVLKQGERQAATPPPPPTGKTDLPAPPPPPPSDGPPTVPSRESFSIPEAGYCMTERTLRTPQGVLHCDGVRADTAFALLDLSNKPTKDTTVNVWPGPRCPTSCCPQCKYIESVLTRDVVGRST